jgi:hypothetical protein
MVSMNWDAGIGFDQIGLATGFADALLVAPHRKGGHRDHRNSLELGVLAQKKGPGLLKHGAL